MNGIVVYKNYNKKVRAILMAIYNVAFGQSSYLTKSTSLSVTMSQWDGRLNYDESLEYTLGGMAKSANPPPNM